MAVTPECEAECRRPGHVPLRFAESIRCYCWGHAETITEEYPGVSVAHPLDFVEERERLSDVDHDRVKA